MYNLAWPADKAGPNEPEGRKDQTNQPAGQTFSHSWMKAFLYPLTKLFTQSSTQKQNKIKPIPFEFKNFFLSDKRWFHHKTHLKCFTIIWRPHINYQVWSSHCWTVAEQMMMYMTSKKKHLEISFRFLWCYCFDNRVLDNIYFSWWKNVGSLDWYLFICSLGIKLCLYQQSDLC